jgi:hypothetical protein
MDETLRAVLKTLPPKRGASKLDPYEALIRELRRRRHTYREIVAILHDRCDLHVGLHTVYHFVRARARKPPTAPRARQRRAHGVHPSTRRAQVAARPASIVTDDVRQRIAAVKARAIPATTVAPKEFAYDEDQPLQLVPRSKSKKERR